MSGWLEKIARGVERARLPGELHGFPVAAGELPLVGHAVSAHADAIGLLSRARARHGAAFWIALGPKKVLVCVGPDALALLKHPSVVMPARRPRSEYLMGGSVVGLDGEEHRRLRNAMAPSFAPRGLTRANVDAVLGEVLGTAVQCVPERAPWRLVGELRALALEVLLRVIGVPHNDVTRWMDRFRHLFWGLVPPTWDLPGSPRRLALQAAARLDSDLRALLRTPSVGRSSSLVASLLTASEDAGGALGEAELISNLRVLLIAGHESVATTMAWSVVELARHPAVWRRLCEGPPSDAFATAIYRETLRIHGPAWLLERRTTAPVEHAGIVIPADTAIAVSPSLSARDEGGDPFDPTRWLTRNPPRADDLAPFGGGPHFCLGYHLAMREGATLLQLLSRRFGSRGDVPVLETPQGLTVRYLPLPHLDARTAISFRPAASGARGFS
jgi:cytochrome P450 family 117 subfamily A